MWLIAVVTAFPTVQGLLQRPCEGGIHPFMLPGFRFLFAAIILSMSVLIFGLGAAALLRAAHEEFASTPAWHATPETMFAQQGEATRPMLALLRVDTPPEPKPSDRVSAQPAIVSSPAEPETTAALKPEHSPPAEAAKPEIPAAETSPPAETAPAASASVDETKLAALPENVAVPAVSEQVSVPNSPDADSVSAKIATLGGPAVNIEPPAVSATPEKSIVRKRRHVERAKPRHRVVHRARLIAQTPLQPGEGFSQPTMTVRNR
jgi:hypothetical protein